MIKFFASGFPLEDVAIGARFLRDLPHFLQHRLSVEEARAILRQRLEYREADFLRVARRFIYDHPASPYRRLLENCGCEYGDLTQLVEEEGLEGALRILLERGVYLTVDEFKGRRPVVRGSASYLLDVAQLRNPGAAVHAVAQSSGSRGARTVVQLDLAYVRDNAVSACLALDARGGIGWRHAVWGDPGTIAIVQLLMTAFGAAPLHWFSQVDPASPGVHPRYRWSVRAIRLGSLLAGVPLPDPEYVPLDDPLPIARWMAGEQRAGRTPHLMTFASTAVRVCLAALEAGLDIRGSQFSIGGEPITSARLEVVRRAGGVALPHYGTMESGGVGTECLAPDAPDDVHLCRDRVALIQPGSAGQSCGLPASALLISSLRPTAPFILLNVSTGDQAAVVQRTCGCRRGGKDASIHLHTIRSFEKLTAGGMTFLDTDVIHVLEEVLPARFGGAPTSYQLLEEADENGRPRLRLLVHPAVGPLDESAIANIFMDAIGAGSERERVMALQWRQANLLTVERRAPLPAASGKILHLQLGHRAEAIPRSA